MRIENYHLMNLHPYCEMFPEMPEDEFALLKEDISGSGQLEPIVVFGGKILDGRHRFRACMELEIEPWFKEYDGPDSPLDYVWSANIRRRHLSPSQLAMVVERRTNLIKGSNQFSARTIEGVAEDGEISPSKSVTDLAKEAGIDMSTIKHAKQVRRNGSPELIKAVESGKVAVSAAAKVVKAVPDKGQQDEVLQASAGNPRKIVEIAKAAKIHTPLGNDAILASEWQDGTPISVETDKAFNLQEGDSIGWAAYSWNPVTGCTLGCDYCYARGMAERFYDKRIGFNPALHRDRVLAPYNKQPKANNNRVFVCSMADLFAKEIPDSWINEVLRVCGENPQFEFLLLTKQPARLTDFDYPANCLVGTTTDTQRRMDVASKIFERLPSTTRKWLSVEPMMEPIIAPNPALFEWYAIGGMSGKVAFVPPWDWVFRLAMQAHDAGSKVWIKDNFWNLGRPKEI
jgi:protein gp37